MFIDEEGKKELSAASAAEEPSFFVSHKKLIIIIAAVSAGVLVLAALIWAFIYFRQPDDMADPVEVVEEKPATLPIDEKEQAALVEEIFDTDVKAEIITFGDYYRKLEDDFVPSAKNYSLPINIKTEISNYYDTSRVINLDVAVDSLNAEGFALIDNPLPGQMDFFTANIFLKEKEVPLLLTGDFLLYYQQNVLKEVYKDIEANAFYENLWGISKKLFDIANARYRAHKQEVGLASDTLLEAERLAAAFWAVSLELLEPKSEKDLQQIGLTSGLGFTLQEAQKFGFELPDYLAEDVQKELELIRANQAVAKSPVMRYQKDYSAFYVPKEYKKSARLNNFFLASKWLNSVWPLYTTSEFCPTCFLDKDDGRVNFIAASLIADDFARNQDIKNQWAIVYKVLAFFSGLRRDLNYLHYHDSLAKNFGDDYLLGDIFSNPDTVDQNIELLKTTLSAYEFSDIEGGFSRVGEDQTTVGMRVLSDFFWPNSYLLQQFIYPEIGLGDEALKDSDLDVTSCSSSFSKTKASLTRCRAIGLDVINLVHKIPADNEYFTTNSQYENYDKQDVKLSRAIAAFNQDSWRNNNFWATLDTLKVMLENNETKNPVYMQSAGWQDKKLNTTLGALLNLQLEADTWSLQARGGQLGQSRGCDMNNYVEPDLDLINELISNSKMLLETLTALKVTDKVNKVGVNLEDLVRRLEKIKTIVKKELDQEKITMDDCIEIDTLANQYQISDIAKREKNFIFDAKGRNIIKESINNIKFLVLVYEQDGEKIIAVGPAFNFKETKQ